jgi:hypothetical protein
VFGVERGETKQATVSGEFSFNAHLAFDAMSSEIVGVHQVSVDAPMQGLEELQGFESLLQAHGVAILDGGRVAVACGLDRAPRISVRSGSSIDVDGDIAILSGAIPDLCALSGGMQTKLLRL